MIPVILIVLAALAFLFCAIDQPIGSLDLTAWGLFLFAAAHFPWGGPGWGYWRRQRRRPE